MLSKKIPPSVTAAQALQPSALKLSSGAGMVHNQHPYKALLVTVEHGGADATLELLRSLRRLDHFESLYVIIVSNGSISGASSRTPPIIEAQTNVQLVESPTNRGYFGGAKRGIEWYRTVRGQLPHWVIICNNDIKIAENLFLERLFSLDPDNVGVIAPRIISSRMGLNQNPFMRQRPGRWRVAELRFWLANYQLARFHEHLSLLKKNFRRRITQFTRSQKEAGPARPMAIYAPHGSFMIFSQEFFKRGGYIDDGSFLYLEEVIVAEICRQIALPVVYNPNLTVLHDEHRTIGRKFSRKAYQHSKEAFKYLAARYLADVA